MKKRFFKILLTSVSVVLLETQLAGALTPFGSCKVQEGVYYCAYGWFTPGMKTRDIDKDDCIGLKSDRYVKSVTVSINQGGKIVSDTSYNSDMAKASIFNNPFIGQKVSWTWKYWK